MRRFFSVVASPPPRALSSAAAISLEDRFCARTYSPLPFVVSSAAGCLTYDPEGVCRIDFLAAFSAVNQGHCHPRILAALREQASRLTLISRAFHSDRLGPFAELLCGTMGYERMLPANSGVEGWEVAVTEGEPEGVKSPVLVPVTAGDLELEGDTVFVLEARGDTEEEGV